MLLYRLELEGEDELVLVVDWDVVSGIDVRRRESRSNGRRMKLGVEFIEIFNEFFFLVFVIW